MPTIFEHSARIINKTPSETARSRELLEEAQVQSYLLYRQDAVTVGVDVYNIEAEALGCKVKFHEDNSVPGILTHPLCNAYNLDEISFSVGKGRIGIILGAAEGVKKKIGEHVSVGVGISGPFSICAELVGFEKLIGDCMDDEESVHLLLDRVLSFQKDYCREIAGRGLGITLFESWAAPPLLTPGIYREFAMPYERELISYIKSLGLKMAPLVIGGDTSAILEDMLSTGTTLLISDFKADMEYFIEKARERNVALRGNIDPKLVERGPREEILRQLEMMLGKVNGYDKFIVGTGVLPYGTPPENVIAIREYIEALYGS